MKYTLSILITLFLGLSALASDPKPYWLIKPFSVVTDDGVRGYPVGTMVLKEGDKYRLDSGLAYLPDAYVTGDKEVAAALLPVAKPVGQHETLRPTPKPVETPKATPAPQKAPVAANSLGAPSLGLSGPLGARK